MNEEEREREAMLVADKIDELYKCVMEAFFQDKLIVYNPKIFCKLSREDFSKWIISNNAQVRDLFSKRPSN